MTPEEKARIEIDKKLVQSGWVIQDMKRIDLSARPGVAVREFPTDTGEADYALFVEGKPVGIIEAKRDEKGETITAIEEQTERYRASRFKWITNEYKIRFAYEATSKITRFTDYNDIKYRSRTVFSFHRPETLKDLLSAPDTIRNNMKHFPPLDHTGLRDCQITAIENLENSFAENRPRALIQMATGAGKTFTAITAAYRLLKYAGMNRILFLVDTKNLGEQAEQAFMAFTPTDDSRPFSNIYGVYRLKSSMIPEDTQIYISTIQRMYSLLRGEPLDEKAEETAPAELEGLPIPNPKEVVYNEKIPPEFFDCIIVDECHRSIYNVWNQVLEYFDAFIVGLTATPDKRTFAYFQRNVVSEYSREKAIIDGVNVGEDVFIINTEITRRGANILKQRIEYRDRLSRARRWKEMDDDFSYTGKQLDRDVVNPSQIRTVIQAFKDNLYTVLFPHRKEVPKTLIFAKTDSHADDIVQTVREVFGEGNEFCRKITYAAENPGQILSSFRNDYYPRIAVTVDMIAAGTDVKAIECLIFMRDVRSSNYFEQMKGRGTRTLSRDDLQKVTPSATENKDHFVIVDAVGVTTSVKTTTRSLECKPTISMEKLMMSVALGAKDNKTLTSLANRITRLDKKLTDSEKKEFIQTIGMTPGALVQNLLDAFDEDVIAKKAGLDLSEMYGDPSPEEKKRLKAAQAELLTEAVKPFYNPDNRDLIEGLRRRHDQIIDEVNLDHVISAVYDKDRSSYAEETIRSFREFIQENMDEIIVLRIIYDQRYADRPMAIEGLKKLYEKMERRHLTIQRLDDVYTLRFPGEKVKRGTMAKLTDLISIIRFELGYRGELAPFADEVNYNFMRWTLKKNAGADHFSEEQMEWLRLIKDHIIASLSVEPEDLDLTPFDSKGGLGRFYELFGSEFQAILDEMNRELVL